MQARVGAVLGQNSVAAISRHALNPRKFLPDIQDLDSVSSKHSWVMSGWCQPRPNKYSFHWKFPLEQGGYFCFCSFKIWGQNRNFWESGLYILDLVAFSQAVVPISSFPSQPTDAGLRIHSKSLFPKDFHCCTGCLYSFA